MAGQGRPPNGALPLGTQRRRQLLVRRWSRCFFTYSLILLFVLEFLLSVWRVTEISFKIRFSPTSLRPHYFIRLQVSSQHIFIMHRHACIFTPRYSPGSKHVLCILSWVIVSVPVGACMLCVGACTCVFDGLAFCTWSARALRAAGRCPIDVSVWACLRLRVVC